jgi:uncharacterized protein YegP (UPF0339 family)
MKFEIYRSGVIRREWRWRLRAQNGRIVANGGEGFRNLADLHRSIDLVQRSADCARLTVQR